MPALDVKGSRTRRSYIQIKSMVIFMRFVITIELLNNGNVSRIEDRILMRWTGLHELALVEGIISAVLDLARKKGGRVLGFSISIGELAQFDKTLIRDLLTELVKGTELEGANIDIETEKAVIKCLSCGSKWGFKELVGPLPEDWREMIHFLPELVSSFSKCPICGKSDFEIEEGRSVRIVEVELDV